MTGDRRTRPPRRFWPPVCGRLTLNNIRGPWRPSATVAALRVFAVVWLTGYSDLWAPLHDCDPIDQLRLIEACCRLEHVEGRHGRLVEAFLG